MPQQAKTQLPFTLLEVKYSVCACEHSWEQESDLSKQNYLEHNIIIIVLQQKQDYI